jgi:hypothetical protein
VDIAAQMVDLTQYQTGVPHKSFARRGQGHALAIAMEQTGSKMIFKIFDPIAGGGQRKMRFFGPTGQAARIANVDHELQIGQIKMVRHRVFSTLIIQKAEVNETPMVKNPALGHIID